MAKVIYEFDMSDPHDREREDAFRKGPAYKDHLDDFWNSGLRPIYKHGMFKGQPLTERERELVEYLHSKLIPLPH